MSKSGVTFVSLVTFAFVPFYMTCKMCTYLLPECDRLFKDGAGSMTSWHTWDRKWNVTENLWSLPQVLLLVATVAGYDGKVLVMISEDALIGVLTQACQDGWMSLNRGRWLMSCTFLYHASTLLTRYLCIFSDSIKNIHTLYKLLIFFFGWKHTWLFILTIQTRCISPLWS